MFARGGAGQLIFVILAASFVVACGTVDFNSLIVIFDANGVKITPCGSTSTSNVIAKIQDPLLVQNQIRETWGSVLSENSIRALDRIVR